MENHVSCRRLFKPISRWPEDQNAYCNINYLNGSFSSSQSPDVLANNEDRSLKMTVTTKKGTYCHSGRCCIISRRRQRNQLFHGNWLIQPDYLLSGKMPGMCVNIHQLHYENHQRMKERLILRFTSQQTWGKDSLFKA